MPVRVSFRNVNDHPGAHRKVKVVQTLNSAGAVTHTAAYERLGCVQAFSRASGNTYEISVWVDGIPTCNCRGWVFSKGNPQTCKHIAENRAEIERICRLFEQQIARAAAAVNPGQVWRPPAGSNRVRILPPLSSLDEVLAARAQQLLEDVSRGRARRARSRKQPQQPPAAPEPKPLPTRKIVLDD